MDWLYRFIDVCVRRNVRLDDCFNPHYEDFWTTWNLYWLALLCSSVALTVYIQMQKPLEIIYWEDETWEEEEEECSEARGDADLINMEPPLELYTNILNGADDPSIK